MALKLNAEPTFRAKVEIPVPGGKPEPIEFIFKHRKKDELREFLETSKDLEDPDYVLQIAMGWELSEEFNRENIVRLLQNYHGAGAAISVTYVSELRGVGKFSPAREGN